MPEAQIKRIEIHHREIGAGNPVFLLRGFTGNLRNRTLAGFLSRVHQGTAAGG